MNLRQHSGAAVAALTDAAAVILFVTLGRRSHDEGSGIGATLEVAAPFLIAAALAWAVVLTRRWCPRSIRTGTIVWIVTVAVGMLLRRTVFDRGTATSFVIVATIALGLFLVGWRALAARSAARRRATTAA